MSNKNNESDDADILDSDGETHSTTVRHDWVKHDEVSVTIVEAVADATDRTTTALPQLHQTVDPDGLDALLGQGPSSSVTLSFEYAGTTVWVAADGTIQVQVDKSARDGDE
ncbi:HalOD1 output domain-containing protein [Halobellus marinus]|uniref:HalOD1 output domain-containing protein n=1 Tax=Halobellus TaxID=1073986 RepID=UPI0028AB24D3|nr:HalOD1 output domain-containing protein [Halobellus sp. DFY28]